MPAFKIINNPRDITLSHQWVPSTKFNSKDRIVDAEGKAVGSDYKGNQYRIIEKRERTFSIPDRIGRGFLGTLAVVCTLCLALFSKSVRNLFIKPKENIRFAILESTFSHSLEQQSINTTPSMLDSQTKSTKKEIDQPSQVTSPKTSNIKVRNNIHVTIPSEVKKTLDQLFQGSSYAIDNLPIYPFILNQKDHGAPKREVMMAPVMKGITDDGHPFIAIKVDCNLRDEDIEKNAGSYEEIQNYYKTHRQLKDTLVLYQYHSNGPLFWGGEGKFMWDQLGRGQSMSPSFFTWNFTYAEDGTGPTKSQKDNFKLVQTLLKTGQSEDLSGLIWRIPAE